MSFAPMVEKSTKPEIRLTPPQHRISSRRSTKKKLLEILPPFGAAFLLHDPGRYDLPEFTLVTGVKNGVPAVGEFKSFSQRGKYKGTFWQCQNTIILHMLQHRARS